MGDVFPCGGGGGEGGESTAAGGGELTNLLGLSIIVDWKVH